MRIINSVRDGEAERYVQLGNMRFSLCDCNMIENVPIRSFGFCLPYTPLLRGFVCSFSQLLRRARVHVFKGFCHCLLAIPHTNRPHILGIG